MATSPKRSAAAANAAADAMAALLNGGTVKIYSGAVPADVAAGLGGAVLLGTLTLGNPAFGAASNGVATANAITDDSSADTDGTASFFRACNSGGTAVLQGLVGTSGCDLNLNSVSLVTGARISITSFTITEGLG